MNESVAETSLRPQGSTIMKMIRFSPCSLVDIQAIPMSDREANHDDTRNRIEPRQRHHFLFYLFV